ncbi:MAG: hypothetical protein Kow0099_13480 [Candidatus Abyssubacteria bacterium]
MRKDSLTIVAKKGYDRSFKDFAIPEPSHETCVGAPSGRGPLTILALGEDRSERALVRTCRRGGVLGWVLGGLYLNLGTPRSLRELEVSEYARSRGIPTPEVLAAAYERVTPVFYKCALATRELQSGTDLKEALVAMARSPDGVSLEKWRRTISALGRLVARMHRAGIYHADLHLKNVFASGDELYVLDLDAAKIQNPLSELKKYRNLLRLYRSALKLNHGPGRLTRTTLLRFIRSYAAESSCSFRELTSRLSRLLPFWRLKWKLSDMLGV